MLEKCYALEDEETMREVMAEPRKLHGPLTGVLKNGGRRATLGGPSRQWPGGPLTALGWM